MTKQHFEALAAALKGSKPDEPIVMEPPAYVACPATDQWRADVRAVAGALQTPALAQSCTTARFYAACGYEGDR